MKTLKDISWDVSEPEYRADPALSYSVLAKFEREGFDGLNTLFDKIDTPSLTFGSAVDALVTGGQEEFENRFFVAEFPQLSDSVLKVVNECFTRGSEQYTSLEEFPDKAIIGITEDLKYQLNWKPETRAKVIREQGGEYYHLLFVAGDRKVVSTSFKSEVDNCVALLMGSPATSVYFTSLAYERWYQLKFKAVLGDFEYKCMADMLLVDNEHKVIYPVDLKTSGHPEWDFYDSFIQWNYQIQARLYWRIIRDNLDKDEYFKDYRLANYRFVVISRKTATPLVWEFEDTQVYGTLCYGRDCKVEMRDPLDIGEELYSYLLSRPLVPAGIKLNEPNNITKWINEKK